MRIAAESARISGGGIDNGLDAIATDDRARGVALGGGSAAALPPCVTSGATRAPWAVGGTISRAVEGFRAVGGGKVVASLVTNGGGSGSMGLAGTAGGSGCAQ